MREQLMNYLSSVAHCSALTRSIKVIMHAEVPVGRERPTSRGYLVWTITFNIARHVAVLRMMMLNFVS
jgi:hypothetical protein